MNLTEKLILDIKKRENLYEKMYKIVNSHGRVIDKVNSDEELQQYNDEHEDEEYVAVEINNETNSSPKFIKKPISKTSDTIKQEVNNFYKRYFEFRNLQQKRLDDIVKYSGSGSSEYREFTFDLPKMLRHWWATESKKLSKEAKQYLKNKAKNLNESTNILTEEQKQKEFYQNILEASFNPNVKSSWITQIWFEPNEDFAEDEEGNIIESNPHDPNLKGTVFMRVKNSKTGKVYPTYEFYDVPRKIYIMWRRARSKGKYFWRRMKYNYEG